MVEFIRCHIPDVVEVRPDRFGDGRGFFSETFSAAAFAGQDLPCDYVQDNHSLSAAAGTVRGLHFQLPPYAQDKLVRVVRGAVLDVAVDIRRGSPTFGRHVAVALSARDWNQLLIPVGFAHGFCTLEPGTEVQYKVTAPYAPARERAVLWCDPALGIAWPVSAQAAVLSQKDKAAPVLAQADELF